MHLLKKQLPLYWKLMESNSSFSLKPFGPPEGSNNSTHGCAATARVYDFSPAMFLVKPMDHIFFQVS